MTQFQIVFIFKLTGRGIVFAGRILNGTIKIGNKIKLTLPNENKTWTISGLEGIRHSQQAQVNLGLVIKNVDEKEMEELTGSEIRDIIVEVID